MSKSELHAIVERGHELAASTRARYLRDLDAFTDFAGTNPSNWTPKIAEDFYAALLERMSAQSASRLFASVAYAAKWRAQQQHVPNFTDARASSREGYEPLYETTAKKLLAACMGDRNAPTPLNLRDTALIVVELETGMRRRALQSMSWDKIERESAYGYPIARVLMKNQRQIIPLSETALRALEPWQQWLGTIKGPVFRSLGRKRVNDTLTHKAGKTALTPTAIQDLMSKRAEQAGIGRVHPYLFRHTFVTWRLSAGISPNELSMFMSGEGGNLDMRDIGEKVRNSTPQWLKELFS